MSELSPSILAANFNRLGADIKAVEDEDIDMLHVDVMDGMFVPSISFGMPVIESIRKESNMFFDVHLMVEEPLRYIKEFVDAGADGITVHVEACEDLKKTIDEIKKHGVKTAVAVNPATDIERVYDVLDSNLSHHEGILTATFFTPSAFMEILPSSGYFVVISHLISPSERTLSANWLT